MPEDGGLTVELAPLALEPLDEPWLPGQRPYAYQVRILQQVREALDRRETLCLVVATPTGSGKTLGAFAYSILHGEPAFGVYPTNELIRDQERALRPRIDPSGEGRLLRIDSAQLDHWQAVLDLRRHSETLEKLMSWNPTILTNPDILFYTFFGLYEGPPGLSQRLFTLIGSYRLFIFDEFHLYNVKQIADVAFLVGALHAINPTYGRVFLFASATPDAPILPWLRDRLGIPTEVITAEFSAASTAHLIAHPLRLTVLPADLRRWKGEEALLAYLSEIERFLQEYPSARIVTILDSVAAAVALAEHLRARWPGQVGEVHGLSSEAERGEALRRPFTVGTSTIEVGIDFKEEAAKDLLIFEARTASQFIQRLGRIARHSKSSPIPNWAVALVPEYVYHYLAGKLNSGQIVPRPQLYTLVEEAYEQPEDFARYLRTHAPAEFQEAVVHALTLFQPDDRPRIRKALEEVVRRLTDRPAGYAWGVRNRYHEAGILAPLLTFRSPSLEVAIWDDRGTDPGFPVKRYDLFFVLRRGIFEEMDPEEFFRRLESLADRWPEEVARERRRCQRIGLSPDDLLGVYGYIRLTGLRDSPRRVWLEIGEDDLGSPAEVTVLEGLQVCVEPEVRLRRLNRHLGRKRIVAWWAPQHPMAVRLGRALPPLFEVYELRVRRPGGALSSPYSIALYQDAFFLDCLGWGKPTGGPALIL